MLDGLTVVRWRAEGRDRLHVEGPDGERLGQLDLHSGRQRIAVPTARRQVEDAIADWLVAHPAVRPPAGAAAPSAPADRATTSTVVPVAAPRPAGLTRALHAGRGAVARRRQRVTVTISVPGTPAERRLTRRLDRVGPGWRLLPAAPIGAADGEPAHLVVGPAGVWCLRVQERPHATVWVSGDVLVADGRRRDDVPRVRALAEQAARRLALVTGTPVAVRGLVVPIGASRLTVRRPSAGVAVVGAREVQQWLRAQPPVLDQQRVEALVEAAGRRETWQ
ncbi:hypothetical protein [Angustibacter aerolatus]